MHGFGIARRVEQISGGVFKVNPGSLLTALQRLERAGWLDAEWRQTPNSRRAKFYTLTRAGRKQLEIESADWARRAETFSAWCSVRACSWQGWVSHSGSAALATSQALATLLFGISRLYPVTYMAVIGLMLAVSLIACWTPCVARGATRSGGHVARRMTEFRAATDL
jgi:DNA-binding MarR family transcriptional regulator